MSATGILNWTGPGDPFHHGGPSREIADAIHAHCATDSQGRRYYRLSDGPMLGPWKRLRGQDAAAWLALNGEIDRMRGATKWR